MLSLKMPIISFKNYRLQSVRSATVQMRIVTKIQLYKQEDVEQAQQ